MGRRVSLCYCNFCGRSQREVETLIGGVDVYICDGCVDIAHDIVKTRRAEVSRAETEEGKPRRSGRGRPDYLDRRVRAL